MKGAICFVLFSAGLVAQSTAKLDSDLATLSNPNAPLASIATRITDDILALAEKDEQPSRQAVLDFGIELRKALAGKPSSQPKIQAVSAAIVDVLASAGAPSYRFHNAIDHLRDALIDLGATASQAKSAAGRLMTLGQEVRGPDDIKSRLQFRSIPK
jgi:hypothetical protein